jgi:hypothetical protein
MLDQLFEISRKAAESSLQMQQAMFKQLTQNMLSTSPVAVGISADWGGSMRKQWITGTIEALNKQREAIDTAYRAGMQMIEQAARASEAKSAEEAVRAIEELWRKVFDGYKGQAEAQFREYQTWAAKAFEMAHNKTETT